MRKNIIINIISSPRSRSTSTGFSISQCFGLNFVNEPISRDNPGQNSGIRVIEEYIKLHPPLIGLSSKVMARAIQHGGEDPLPWLSMGLVTVFIIRNPLEQATSYLKALLADNDLQGISKSHIVDRLIQRSGWEEMYSQYLILREKSNQPLLVIEGSDYSIYPNKYILKLENLIGRRSLKDPRDTWPKRNDQNFYNPSVSRFAGRDNPWMETFYKANRLMPEIKSVGKPYFSQLKCANSERLLDFIGEVAMPIFNKMNSK